jgi:phosphoribosyl 1,2-cyclic phosphodiesterase
VEVRLGGGQPVILDAGTGLRELGRKLSEENCRRAHLLLTHFHWDHIQGLPFFEPLYRPECDLSVWSVVSPERVQEILEVQMSAPYFPVTMSEKPRRPDYEMLRAGRMEVAGIEVETVELNHPDGATGYKLSAGGRSIVYATDHEPGNKEVDEGLVRQCEGVDLLIIDSQYTPEEHVTRRGWGHGTWLNSVEAGRAAGVKKVALFHHDPWRNDAAVEELVKQARGEFGAVEAAYEGWTVTL